MTSGAPAVASMRKTWLFLPPTSRVSDRARPKPARAVSAVASASKPSSASASDVRMAELRGNLGPRRTEVELSPTGGSRELPLGIEQDTAHSRRKTRQRKDFREIVDEHVAAKESRASDLVFLGQCEEQVARIDLVAAQADQPARCQKASRRGVQIMLRPADRGARFVADDEQLVAGFPRGRDEIGKAGIGRRQLHAGAIDVALQLRKRVGAAGAVEIIAHAVLVARQMGGDQSALQSRCMKDAIVANDRVVEIDSDAHDYARSDMSIRGRPIVPDARSCKACSACSSA